MSGVVVPLGRRSLGATVQQQLPGGVIIQLRRNPHPSRPSRRYSGTRSVASSSRSITSSPATKLRPTTCLSSPATTTTTTRASSCRSFSSSSSSSSPLPSSSSSPSFSLSTTRSRPTTSASSSPTHMSFLKKFFSGPDPATMAKASEKAQKLIDDNKVVVFSKSYCPYCKSTKNTLQSLKADYAVIELDQESDGSDIQDALAEISGQRTVPNVYIGQKHIGGNSDVQDLQSREKLEGLLREVGAIAA